MLLVKNFTSFKIDRKYLNKIANKTLKVAGFRKPAEVSLVITGEKRMKTLNKKYRGVDRVTDVLSFGYEEAKNKNAKFISSPSEVVSLGEVFICYNQAKKQAQQSKRSVKKELAILLIHGVLHLLGYDHKGSYEKSEMKIKEEKVLRGFEK